MLSQARGEVKPDARRHDFAERRVERRGLQAGLERGAVGHVVARQSGVEGKVLFAARYVLRNGEVVDFEAPAPDEAGVLAFDEDQPVAPAVRENGRRLIDAVGVVAEGGLKGRAFPDGGVDEFGARPRIAWLPTTMSSSMLAIVPAARITCSSSARVMTTPACTHRRSPTALAA